MTEFSRACFKGQDYYALRNEANRWCEWDNDSKKTEGKTNSTSVRQSPARRGARPACVLETPKRSEALEMPFPSRDPSCWFLPGT